MNSLGLQHVPAIRPVEQIVVEIDECSVDPCDLGSQRPSQRLRRRRRGRPNRSRRPTEKSRRSAMVCCRPQQTRHDQRRCTSFEMPQHLVLKVDVAIRSVGAMKFEQPSRAIGEIEPSVLVVLTRKASHRCVQSEHVAGDGSQVGLRQGGYARTTRTCASPTTAARPTRAPWPRRLRRSRGRSGPSRSLLPIVRP